MPGLFSDESGSESDSPPDKELHIRWFVPWYKTRSGIAVITICAIVVFVGLVWWVGYLILDAMFTESVGGTRQPLFV